jgi:2-oxoglutarate ferredoxin oxidoreductase subunit beta
VAVALGAGATFAARTVDTDLVHLQYVLRRAAEHRGTAFVEVLQNCIVFNDGAYSTLIDKATRDDARIVLEHGKPVIFGKNRDKGIRLRGLEPEIVSVGESGAERVLTESDLIVHDEAAAHSGLAFLLAQLDPPEFPLPLGVFRAIDLPPYEQLNTQIAADARTKKGRGTLQELFNSGDTWTIT